MTGHIPQHFLLLCYFKANKLLGPNEKFISRVQKAKKSHFLNSFFKPRFGATLTFQCIKILGRNWIEKQKPKYICRISIEMAFPSCRLTPSLRTSDWPIRQWNRMQGANEMLYTWNERQIKDIERLLNVHLFRECNFHWNGKSVFIYEGSCCL